VKEFLECRKAQMLSQRRWRRRAQICRERFLIGVGFPHNDPKQIGGSDANGERKKIPKSAREHAAQRRPLVMVLRIEVIQGATMKHENRHKEKSGEENVQDQVPGVCHGQQQPACKQAEQR